MIRIIPKPTDRPDDNSTQMVKDALDAMGAEYEILLLRDQDPFRILYHDDLIWVCGIRQDGIEFELIKALSLKNRLVNTPEAIATCASKVMTSALLVHHGVPTPETLFTGLHSDVDAFLGRHGKAVYKPVYGFDGDGIFLFSNTADLADPPYYVQEYVKNDRDFRVFVIGYQAVGAIYRQSPHLTHNIHKGGTGTPVEIDPAMRAISEAAAKAIGIDYCGVDLLKTGEGYTVLEVNGTPNWHCMSAPIPQLLAEYLVKEEGKC
ncbi:MAG: ATP-grasp domain-containing protein [Methanocalculus sp.]|uniref:ATP-grasp domain-containing protein n=1 Tax=Methanocalculus sp. TaxID=2004547 RepID=UPI0027213C37|nr:ATP-grasp domain-containing protein [Methanocalculus sp.]MDO9538800.1 ATP-grasp domain-containing protein [Methanocalculus sp.]